MALLFRGKTLCPICSKVIGVNDSIVAVPPLITNKFDKLFKYNDSSYHLACAGKNPDFELLQKLTEIWESRSSNRTSFLSKEPILCPEDFYSFPYFGEGDFFTEINFQQCNRHELANWKALPELIENLQKVLESGAWDAAKLECIIGELKTLGNLEG